ncbi:MAG: hypothetical protein PV344_04975 [Anaplasma sp.]|nr:hypothetical protein [Anaplasma sp.]
MEVPLFFWEGLHVLIYRVFLFIQTSYCKRLNFREDLIFANRSPANNSGTMSTLRKLHSIREN